MKRVFRPISVLGVVAALAIVIAACAPPPSGGGGGGTTTTTEATTTTTAPEPTCASTGGGTKLLDGPVVQTTALPGGIPNTNKVDDVTVCFDGMPANVKIFVTQCRRSQNSTGFNPGIDCIILSQKLLNISQNPTGAGQVDMSLFHGDEPSTDESWGCYADGDTVTPGYTDYSPCYVGISQDFPNNLSQRQEIQFDFVL